MQGDVLAPFVSSLQVDTMGKECIEEKKHLYFFKGIVPIGPLGMVDDLLTISECGFKTSFMNQFINFKTATKSCYTRSYESVNIALKTCRINEIAYQNLKHMSVNLGA